MNVSKTVNRRVFTALSGGFVVALANRSHGVAQEATPLASPVAIQPLGYASMRLRVITRPEARAEVNDLVESDFLPVITGLRGYGGYVLADVADVATETITLVVFENADQLNAFNDAAASFVELVGDRVDGPATKAWSGDILMKAGPAEIAGSPVAVPIGPFTYGYAAVRIHTSLPGTDPRDFVPEAISGFIPLITVLPGFMGYLWFPVDGGFASITIYDSSESATASSEEAVAWAKEHLAAYTDGNPTIINANIVYNDLHILG
jgi:hypothetical protein